MQVIELIKAQLPEAIKETEQKATKGLLYLPNDKVKRGPKYLIRLHFSLNDNEIEWDAVVPFFNGGCEKLCRTFFAQCNGFPLSYRYGAFGILTQDPYDGQGNSHLNVPFDLRGQSYGSYPQFGPNSGFFIGSIHIGKDDTEICDIVTPKGNIVYGEFRKSNKVMGVFDSFEEWIRKRVSQALADIAMDIKKPIP